MGGSHSEDYGDGSWTKIELPENIIKQNIIKIVGCHDTIMLLTDQRELYGMGRNQSGNLGVSNSNVHFIRISFDHLSSQLPGVLYDIESCYRTSLALFCKFCLTFLIS
jgi:alpha-tubulin suppressor-like RCC1 family protein